jgi:signal transduction histidine kinase
VTRLRTSLFWKLMLAFVAVVLVAVGSVALIARQTTTTEFRRLRQGEGQSSASQQALRLTTYYAENGSWEGVSAIIAEGRGQGRGGRGGPPLRLADGAGQVILNTVDDQLGQRLSEDELAQGEPIVVDGQRVGTLLLGGPGAVSLSQAEQTFLNRVQRALIVAALVAIGVALALGFLLFRGIIGPLRDLTQATAAVAASDWSVQVPVRSGDEIGQLGLAFNCMTAELAQADQLRRDMTADIAHELRTPLTVIQGNLEAILDGVYPADAEHLEPVLRKSQLLKRLVEDLRTLALADAGELALHLAPMDLGRSVQRTLKDFEIRAQAAGVELSGEIPTQLPQVTADASRVEQVLGILLDNALRHTPADGQIKVKLKSEKGKVWLSVRDSGSGIPPEALPHVFERFYRVRPAEPVRTLHADHAVEGNARSADTSWTGGSGLGLAIAKAIIAAHGGRIWAESEPGRGTKMTFTLEQAQSHKE